MRVRLTLSLVSVLVVGLLAGGCSHSHKSSSPPTTSTAGTATTTTTPRTAGTIKTCDDIRKLYGLQPPPAATLQVEQKDLLSIVSVLRQSAPTVPAEIRQPMADITAYYQAVSKASLTAKTIAAFQSAQKAIDNRKQTAGATVVASWYQKNC